MIGKTDTGEPSFDGSGDHFLLGSLAVAGKLAVHVGVPEPGKWYGRSIHGKRLSFISNNLMLFSNYV